MQKRASVQLDLRAVSMIGLAICVVGGAFALIIGHWVWGLVLLGLGIFWAAISLPM